MDDTEERKPVRPVIRINQQAERAHLKRIRRLHGGLSRSGREHGRYTHGKRTKEAIEERRRFSELLREARHVLQGC